MQDVHSRSAGRARCDCEHGNLLTFEDGRIPPTGEGPFMTRLLCGRSLLKSLFAEESGQALRTIFRKCPRHAPKRADGCGTCTCIEELCRCLNSDGGL